MWMLGSFFHLLSIPMIITHVVLKFAVADC